LPTGPALFVYAGHVALVAAVVLLIVQGVQGAAALQETAHLKFATSSVPRAAAAGKRVSLALDVTPKPGIHVYAPGQEGYIAITLTLDASPAFTKTGTAKYPAGEKFLMPAVNETQIVYQKPVRITQDITLASATQLKSTDGVILVKGTLRYQACTDKICFLPATVPVTWTIRIPHAAPRIPPAGL
jgi:DsbC/DsbD-like thiol-disulfide interchange protein